MRNINQSLQSIPMMMTTNIFLLGVGLLCLVNLNGVDGSRTLRVIGMGSKPYLDIRSIKNGVPTGIEMDILSTIAKRLNFSLTFQQTNTWPLEVNGTWKGSVGKVLEGMADIGVGQIAMTSSRFQVIQYSHYIAPHHVVLHSLKPRPLPPYFNLIKPFSRELWASVIICPITVALATAILIERKKGRILNKALILEFDLTASMLCQSRNFCSLAKHPLIPILISWLLFATIMHMAFDCNFRANLISVDYEEDVNSIEDVNKLGKKLFSVRSELLSVLACSTNSDYRKAYREMVKNNRFIKWESGLPLSFDKKMLHEEAVGLFVKTLHSARLDDIQSRFGFIPFRVGSKSITIYYSAYVFSKSSEFFPLFNIPLQYFHDTGLMDKVTKDNLKVDKYGNNLESEPNVPLGMDHVIVALITYSVMMVISTLIFACEKGNLI